MPLRDFDDIFVANLEQQTLKLPAGSVLFQIGQQRDAIYYLLQGTVSFQPNSVTGYDVSETSALANLPLNSGKIQGATAIAKTDVKLLILSENIVSLWTQRSRELYSVQLLDLELPADIADNRFFSHFAQCYRENKLALPSLPQVAIKLNQAMKNDIGIKEVADILQVDAPIATKLIQVANSALYAPDGSITNCQDAIARLGLNTTRNLVMSLSVKELFKCKDAKLMKIMLDAWKSSVFVSSLCFVLAEQCRTINPDDALLAGLVANIGVVPILHFVEQKNTEQYHEADKLLTTLSLLAPSVGSLVL
ncbi:HDOD domain-containing protein, partial [Methylocucumis oryzae]|uniref:HDOD domain-containing protein n=1 Tax=Methylocucumis oryzae TaxID=1632867 RepID=UPI000698D3A4